MAFTARTMPGGPNEGFMSKIVHSGAEGLSPAILLDVAAASAEHENTVTGAAFNTLAGQAISLSIPANGLVAGDVYHVLAYGVVNDNNGTDTLTIALYYGTTALYSVTAVDVADADTFALDLYVHVASTGATGRVVTIGHSQGPDAPGSVFNFKGQVATVDTTAAGALAVQADWDAAHADNEVDLQDCIITYCGRSMQFPA